MADPVVVVVKNLKEFVERKIRQLTLETTAILIETTPRDTGWARANWVPKIGSSEPETSGTRKQAEAGVINTGKQTIGIASVALTYKLEGGSIFISNNVPYVPALNAGSSKQAPSGFIQIAILRALRKVVSTP